nr:uncharacterized protein LOC133612781 [Nerophis lumbriciformis]
MDDPQQEDREKDGPSMVDTHTFSGLMQIPNTQQQASIGQRYMTPLTPTSPRPSCTSIHPSSIHGPLCCSSMRPGYLRPQAPWWPSFTERSRSSSGDTLDTPTARFDRVHVCRRLNRVSFRVSVITTFRRRNRCDVWRGHSLCHRKLWIQKVSFPVSPPSRMSHNAVTWLFKGYFSAAQMVNEKLNALTAEQVVTRVKNSLLQAQ